MSDDAPGDDGIHAAAASEGSGGEVKRGDGQAAAERPTDGGDGQSSLLAPDQVKNHERPGEREPAEHDQQEKESWARTHSGLLVGTAFMGIGLTMASTIVAFLSYQAAAGSSADSQRAARAAESSARAAVRQADAAVRQVAISEKALQLQQQGVTAQLAGVDAQRKSAMSIERQASERQRADIVAGKTMSISISGTAEGGSVEFRNAGIQTILIQAARAASGDSPRQALSNARAKRGEVSDNWRPLVAGNVAQLRVTGPFVGAVASYTDAAGYLHHAFACMQIDVSPPKACPAPADD